MEELVGIKGAVNVLHGKEGHHCSPKVKPQWHSGEKWHKAQWRGQQKELGLFLVLPRQEQWVPPRLGPCPSFLTSLLPRAQGDTSTGWHEHHHSTHVHAHRHKPGSSVCLFSWLTIDRLCPPAHLQSAYQASSSTLLWQHLLDQEYWTSLALSASSSKPKECSSLGLLLCQPVELFSFSFPTSTMRAWLPQPPLSLLGSFFPPLSLSCSGCLKPVLRMNTWAVQEAAPQVLDADCHLKLIIIANCVCSQQDTATRKGKFTC